MEATSEVTHRCSGAAKEWTSVGSERKVSWKPLLFCERDWGIYHSSQFWPGSFPGRLSDLCTQFPTAYRRT